MSQTHDAAPDPRAACLDCGACCASYRVSFYSGEADARAIPESALETLSPVYSCMAGTNRAQPRCVALDGEIGVAVRCTLYEQRPSACREVQAGDDKCRRARARHGLLPLS